MEQLKKAVRKSVTGRKMSDQFYVDGDVNVPEDKGDVGRIVYSQGMLRVEDMKQSGSYVRVSGRIQYQILYLAGGNDGGISVLQGKLPFEEMVYAEEEVLGTLWMKESSAELTVTIVHARKLRLRAMAELEIISQGEEEQYLTLDVEEEEGLCRRWKNVEILTLHKSCRESFRIKEECALPKQSDPVGKVLFTDITQKRTEIRLVSDALQMRGELSIFVLYESTEGKLGWTEQAVPYEGKIDCYGADETMYYQAEPKIVDAMADVKLDEDGELRIFGIEAVMEVCAVVYGEEQADVLEDMYSLKEQVTLEKEEIELSELVMQKACEYSMAEQIRVPELDGQVLQICHTSGKVRIEHTEIVADGIMCEGILQIGFLYIRADDAEPFEIWQGMVPFTYVAECRSAEAGMEYEIQSTCGQPVVSLLGNGEAEIKAVLEFQIFLKRREMVSNICEIHTEPLDKKALSEAPGIVGYVMKNGDKLWDLARKYHTTEKRIREVNEIGEGEPKTGEKILIFKENLGIL